MRKTLPFRDLGAALLLAGFCCVFFWRILTPNPADRGSFPNGDFANQFYAFSVFEAQEWRAGRVPLWSPNAYSGHPFLADVQSAVFYPPSLATMAAEVAAGAGTPSHPFSLFALEIEAIFHFWVASFLTYLFAAYILHSRPAGLVTALTFTYGGYLTGYPALQLAILETDTWLPLVLLGLALRSRAGFLLAGLALGLTFLAGHPQSAMLVVYVSLLYLAWQLVGSPPAGARWPAVARSYPLGAVAGRPPIEAAETPAGDGLAELRRGWLALAGRLAAIAGGLLVLGLALAAVQIVPAAEYMRLSTRSAASFDFLSNGFPLRDLAQGLLPGTVSLYSPLYVGILPLMLAGFGLAVRRDREPLFWGGLGLVALFLSFGGNTLLYNLFYLLVPGFNLFQSQERAALVVSFSLAVLAGYGFRALLAEGATQPAGASRPIAYRLSRAAAVLAAVLAALAAAFYWGWLWQGQAADSPFAAHVSRAALAALLAALSWLWLRTRPAVARGTWIAAAIALVVFDLFTANRATLFQPKPPERQFTARPLVEPMQQDRGVFRASNEYRITGNYGMVYGVEDTSGASPLELRDYASLTKGVPEARLWELLNVKYVLTWRAQLGVPSDVIYQEPKGNDTTYLHRLAKVGPRAYLVYAAQVVSDDEARRRLADPAFDPWQTGLVADGSSLPPALSQAADAQSGNASPAGSGSETARGQEVSIVLRRPDRLVVDVDAAAGGLLVLSEVYYPGWRASVDGGAAPVLRSQLALRAVPVPAGRHRVEMVFDPWTFKVGALISALAWLGLAAAAAWIGFTRRA